MSWLRTSWVFFDGIVLCRVYFPLFCLVCVFGVCLCFAFLVGFGTCMLLFVGVVYVLLGWWLMLDRLFWVRVGLVGFGVWFGVGCWAICVQVVVFGLIFACWSFIPVCCIYFVIGLSGGVGFVFVCFCLGCGVCICLGCGVLILVSVVFAWVFDGWVLFPFVLFW